MYIDSHAHIENKRYDGDRAEVFARAKSAGVEAMLAIGNGDGPGTGTLDCAVKLAQQYDWVYATVGIHPHEAALAKQEDFDELQQVVAGCEGDRVGRNRARLLLRSLAA